MKLDPAHPLCKECYSKWKRYENGDYEEKFCHMCGKSHKSSVNKPVCYDCYKASRETATRATPR